MRAAAAMSALAIALAPATALAHRKHTEVRDHRHSHGSSSGHHHKHSSGGGWGALLVDALVAVTDATSSADASEPDDDDPDSGPTWVLEMGGLARRFQGPAVRHSGSVDGNPYMLDSGAARPGDTAAAAFDMRATVPITDHLYAGADLEVGGLVRSPIQLVDRSDVVVASRILVGSATVVGARMQYGAAELDGEVAAGFHVVSTTVTPTAMTSDDDAPSDSASIVRPLVEARVRGALWLSPRMFVAGQLGTSALDRSDVAVAFSVGFSSRAFARR